MLELKSLALLVVGTVLLAGCNPSTPDSGAATPGAPTATGAKKLTIAVIPKGTTHDYWKSVQAGADEAGKELGAEILWKGPLKEDDRAGQIQVVQQFTADNVSGIVLAPLDKEALAGPVKAAMDKKIPVVVIDSDLAGNAGTDFVSLVATDNRKAGEMGGDRLAKLLNGKGKVVLLRYMEGSASTDAREQGFLDAMKKNPGIQVISDTNYAGATQAEAQTKAMQMIDTLRQADGIFTPNESSTRGMLQALSQNGMAGKVRFVGFDTAETLIDGIRAKQIDALVAQNPRKMGYEGVKAVVAKIKGQAVPPSTDTGAVLVDAANLETPEIKTLLGLK